MTLAANAWDAYETGRLAEALDLCRRALDEHPDDDDMASLLACITADLGLESDVEDALPGAERAARRSPEYAARLAYVLTRRGDRSALELAERAARGAVPPVHDERLGVAVAAWAGGDMIGAAQERLDIAPTDVSAQRVLTHGIGRLKTAGERLTELRAALGRLPSDDVLLPAARVEVRERDLAWAWPALAAGLVLALTALLGLGRVVYGPLLLLFVVATVRNVRRRRREVGTLARLSERARSTGDEAFGWLVRVAQVAMFLVSAPSEPGSLLRALATVTIPVVVLLWAGHRAGVAIRELPAIPRLRPPTRQATAHLAGSDVLPAAPPPAPENDPAPAPAP